MAEQALASDPAALRPLEWRCVGPFQGGRSVAVVGHPTELVVKAADSR